MPTLGEIANMKVGVWNYTSGTDGTVDMAELVNTSDIQGMDECRVISITAIAGATDATISVDNRGDIVIPAGQAITVTPNGTVRNPVLVFTNTASYCIEYVTNNFYGSTRGDI